MPKKHPLHYSLQKKYGLSNKAIAKLTGINESTISTFMNLKRYPLIEEKLTVLLQHFEKNFPVNADKGR